MFSARCHVATLVLDSSLALDVLIGAKQGLQLQIVSLEVERLIIHSIKECNIELSKAHHSRHIRPECYWCDRGGKMKS
ncbi:hypothetical protein BDQ12DRAFT_373694 [Crucibulum laeve]|uniref:Uncharacterized protein n=1 Tax=Crucibulum laeve TaxID=68775 RepID=A0A5C3LPP0_9AGAR|nr:hypothetical protein BDQ12DRAFT_373694 [Crucibulum laeve]